MERIITEIANVGQIDKSKAITKREVKSLAKSSKVFRAMQIAKKHLKNDSYRFIKRTVDISVGLLGTLLLLPILAVVKIAYLKQGDHTPILFKQKRIGKNGKEIEILKVRSMVYNAEEVLENLMKENPQIREEYIKNKKLKDDPRVTKVGAFIRKTSLDEFRTIHKYFNRKNVINTDRVHIYLEKKMIWGNIIIM